MLVSDRDVEHYKQIKDDLDGLRLLVEKSELWVYKAKTIEFLEDKGVKSGVVTPINNPPGTPSAIVNGGIRAKQSKDEDDDDHKDAQIKELQNVTTGKSGLNPPQIEVASPEGIANGNGDAEKMSLSAAVNKVALARRKEQEARKQHFSSIDQNKRGSIVDLDVGPPSDHIQNYKMIQQILVRMNRLCIEKGKPRKHEQRLLRNMGVHTVVLDLLQIPFDKKEDNRMNELMRLAHEFLQNFCLGNQQNQTLLHKHLDLFLTTGLLEAQTMCAIFQDNATLCGDVSEKVVQHFVHCIESHGRHVQYLKFLQTIVRTENQYIR